MALVNRQRWEEELYGLSGAAIERWVRANDLDLSDALASAVYASADKLFFLANKSQEQVTEEYRLLSFEVRRLTEQIEALIRN